MSQLGGDCDADDVSPVSAGSRAAAAVRFEGLAASWALGAPCERSGGRIGLDGVLRAVRGRRSAQVAVRAADDGEGSDLRVRDGGVFLARVGTEAGGGRGLSGSGSGELSEPPDDLRVSAASSWGFQAVVRGSGAVGGGDRRGELRQVVDRRGRRFGRTPPSARR